MTGRAMRFPRHELGVMSDMLRSMAGTLADWQPFGAERTRRRVWGPAVDLFTTDEEVVVRANLPGLAREAVEVTATEADIRIEGDIPQRAEGDPDDEAFLVAERPWGRFERTVGMPVAIRAEEVKAKLQDGVLELRAPKQAPRAEDTGRRISIE